ncbi:hypothetical protein IKF32_00945 [Candidatus Saccharibacteria bacterium]|nr:hypothetical protein [Candidatus Saccharibacteria bacterium]
MKSVRRRSKRLWVILVGVFLIVFGLSFLSQKYHNNEQAKAASLAEFDPGYIISDYQMGNYNSMSEAEIQAFLTKKNPCSNTSYNYYVSLSSNKNYTWHWEDGHFVCLSEELFGDGEVIGEGDTAAHIIWQAAQDYKINPQVLIVLLQKETSLITDPIPNSGDYRKATGYGCPDTAPCSSQYYGFKNQVRKAAELFSTVLNGGWTNYPLGNNYVQYNPNAACGGSIVNIRSLATSALYRYTPYQPNEGALAAGYGTAYCGAYGNRNFYLYFQDWFGGITMETKWMNMETPRYLTTTRKTTMLSLPKTDDSGIVLNEGATNYYVEKTFTNEGRMCLRTIADKNKNINRCVFYDDLEDTAWSFEEMETPRYMKAEEGAVMIDLSTKKEVGKPKDYEYYTKKVVLPDDGMCLIIENDTKNRCVLYSALSEVVYKVYNMETPRYLSPDNNNAEIIDPVTKQKLGQIKKNEKKFFEQKIILPDDSICLLIEKDNTKRGCVKYKALKETWVTMERPREMKMAVNSYKINAITLENDYGIDLMVGLQRKFVMKRYLYNGNWCLQTEYDYERETDNCILFQELSEI